jgi:hypothetical protein
MKKIYTMILLLAIVFPAFAQEEPTEDKPVRTPWESGVLLDQRTTWIPYKGTLEMVMNHRFASVENGISDLYGIWGSSNIRIAFNYSINNKLQIGYGTTRFKRLQDFTVKYSILEQTRSGKIPVALSFFGSFSIDAQNEKFYGEEYKFSNRFSYFGQFIIGRKFTEALSFQVAPSFLHYNMTDSLIDHDKIGLSFAGRYKFSPTMSAIANYDQPLFVKGIREYSEVTNPAKPNFGIGIEISTSTHAFQVFAGSATGLIPQDIMHYNQNNFWDGQFVIGFNITRLWSF